MARRPDPTEFDRQLTQEELKKLRRELSMLSPYHVAESYRRAYEACSMHGGQIPPASAVQELVAAWKLLRSWRRRRRPAERG